MTDKTAWLQNLKEGDAVRVYVQQPRYVESSAQTVIHTTPTRVVVTNAGEFRRRDGLHIGKSGFCKCWIEPEKEPERYHDAVPGKDYEVKK